MAIPEDRFWDLTPREWLALKKVHDAMLWRWALERAMYSNAHFVEQGGEAWIPGDFLGTGNRTERGLKNSLNKFQVQMANVALNKITHKSTPEDTELPAWARG